MSEDFLQFIWNFKLFNMSDLETVDGEKLEIISTGIQNKNSGPDFYDARIKIGDTVWAGTVEIHKKSSDWNIHGHRSDKAYDNVILHVVENNDTVIHRSTGEIIPTLKLIYPEIFKKRYEELSTSAMDIPCANRLAGIDTFKIKFWLTRMATERLEQKTEEINELISKTCGDFEETFHCVLFRYFGFKTNALPFEMLARCLPAKLLRKYCNSLISLEALLFGQAGLLERDDVEDGYFKRLKTEYDFLKFKHELVPMNSAMWKFAKLRPDNFPTVRLAQIASLLNKYQSLWEMFIPLNDLNSIHKMLEVNASEYWDNHYVFGKESTKKVKKLGKTSINILIINVLSPMFFVYSLYKGDESFRDKSLRFLEIADAESNGIIAEWEKYGIKPENALESQALIYLKNRYCMIHNCLKCAVGKEIIQK